MYTKDLTNRVGKILYEFFLVDNLVVLTEIAENLRLWNMCSLIAKKAIKLRSFLNILAKFIEIGSAIHF